MIGSLPESLTVNGVEYDISADYSTALLILEACDDPNLSQQERVAVMLDCLFMHPEKIPVSDAQQACEAAAWFLDGGKDAEAKGACKPSDKQIISWTQDEQMIFAAINKVAGHEVRGSFMHWWTFLGYFSEIGDCLLSTVISIRQKLAKKKPLDKIDREFYKKNRDIIDIRKKYSTDELAERERINAMLG